ncbi:hypothetical protein K7432_005683 [Basidiobolus ranarum]|uniref:General transcription and DNA repair factor IIH subunit TFB5 n=1 Tax=Basidiobolus ranarum TaxID=34480 RepID=A0ABR2WW94_9FUNG
MVKAIKGMIVECDEAVKQIVLNLNNSYHFMIEDLDDTHVFIDGSWLDRLKYEVDKLLDENTYKLEEK